MHYMHVHLDYFLLGFAGWPWVNVLEGLAATPTTLASLAAFKPEPLDGPAIKKRLPNYCAMFSILTFVC